MTEGFYSIAFTGFSGSGFGLLVLHKGVVAGIDAAGATYDGTYAENPAAGTLDVEITLSAPAGVWLVQTGTPLTTPLKLPINVSLPSDLGTEKPVLVQTSLGPVNVAFKKIRDLSN